MKKGDWAAIILIIAFVGLVSYFVVGAIMPSPAKNPEKVPVALPFSASIPEPDKNIFHSDAINPTVRVTIGNQRAASPYDPGER